MNCEKCRSLLSLYIDQMLSQAEEMSFEKHIQQCTSCQEELQILQQLLGDVHLLEDMDVPDEFHENLMQKIQLISETNVNDNNAVNNTIHWKRWHKNLRIVSGIAAVLVVVVLALPLTRSQFSNQAKLKSAMPESAMISEEADAQAFDMRSTHQEEASSGIAEAMESPKVRMFGVENNMIFESLIVETSAYRACKDKMQQLMEEEKYDVVVLEESEEQLKIQIVLPSSKKSELITSIQEIAEVNNIDMQQQEGIQARENDDSTITLTIVIVEEKPDKGK